MPVPFDPRIILNQKPLDTPVWAKELVDIIAKQHNIEPPTVEFYMGDRANGGGGWYHDKLHQIVVVTIFDFMSDLLTIVHEMSHAVVDHDHTPEMYEKMLELVEQFGLNERLAIVQEIEYMPEPFAEAFYRRYLK